jgi:hypothetical protein
VKDGQTVRHRNLVELAVEDVEVCAVVRVDVCQLVQGYLENRLTQAIHTHTQTDTQTDRERERERKKERKRERGREKQR